MIVVNLIPTTTTNNNTGLGMVSSAEKCPLLQQHHKIEQKQNYCQLKRQWLLDRAKSDDNLYAGNRLLRRRLSFPLPNLKNEKSQEMTTPVKETTYWWRVSTTEHTKKNAPFRFWKAEDEDCDYHRVLENLDITSGADINLLVQTVRNYVKKHLNSATDLAEVVQDIYRTTEVQLREKVVFHHMTSERSFLMMYEFEEIFMQGLHQDVAQRILYEEKQSDRILSHKIEDLSWVTVEHLEARINKSDSFVWEFIDKAMLALATIDFRESATEKLKCIMECCKNIFDCLRYSGRRQGADDFLPLLIYVVLQSNPAHLHSNVRYLLQFSNTDRIMKGEEGYYLTHMCSVISYIENLTAVSLGMSEEEFQENMQNMENCDYLPYRRRLSSFICDVYHKAAEQQIIRERQDRLWKFSYDLFQKMEQLKEDIETLQAESELNRRKVQDMMKVHYTDAPISVCPLCLRS